MAKHRMRWLTRLDLGRLVARVLCMVLAVIGALPLLGGFLIRTEPVLDWAASETSRVLHEELGVDATYRVDLQLWPMRVALLDVEVPAIDGGSPAFTASRIAVTPRLFSLLGGRLDVGDVEIDDPRGRFVIRNGKLVNVHHELPASRGNSDGPSLDRAPFRSLAITDAHFDLDIDGTRVDTGTLDLDVFAEPTLRGPSFEIAVHASGAAVDHRRPIPADEHRPAGPDGLTTATDEDVLCRLDARIKAGAEGVLVRRLSTLFMVDDRPQAGTRPTCPGRGDAADPATSVAVRVSQFQITPRQGDAPLVSGHVLLRAPVRLGNRFTANPRMSGWVGLSGDVRFDGSTTLPTFSGRLRGEHLKFDQFMVADEIEASVELVADRVLVPKATIQWSDGELVAKNFQLSPFAPGKPLKLESLEGDIEFGSMMQDLGVTQEPLVSWKLTGTRVKNFEGTLEPLNLDGAIRVDSRDFVVFDKGFQDPARRRMMAIGRGIVSGRIGVRPQYFVLHDISVTSPRSRLNVPLVGIGFRNDIKVSVTPSKVDLSEVSPISDLSLGGQAEISARMFGQNSNPMLEGKLQVDDFILGDLPLGNVTAPRIRFAPLKLDVFEIRGRKGLTDYRVPSVRVDFDSVPGAILTDLSVESDNMRLEDFFRMFHLDKEEAFRGISGRGSVAGRVHFDVGGPRDRCGQGHLTVTGTTTLDRVTVLDETFDGGAGEFTFRWFDQAAGPNGMELRVPSVTLRKGPGTLFGSVAILPKGRVQGELMATGVPMSRVDRMGKLGALIDSRGSALATLSGTVDDLALDTHVELGVARIGRARLAASSLFVALEPRGDERAVAGITRCGNPIPVEALSGAPSKLGNFVVGGQLFGGQVALEKVTLTPSKHLSGEVTLKDLDLGAMAQLDPRTVTPPTGRLSATISLEDVPLDDPASAAASVALEKLEVRSRGFGVRLAERPPLLVMKAGAVDVPALSLALKVPSGLEGIFAMQAKVTELRSEPQIQGELRLAPIQLSELAAGLPEVRQAQGEVRGALTLSGPLRSIRYRGGLELENGAVTVAGFPSPITDLDVALIFDGQEVRVRKGRARLMGGSVRLRGSAPIRGFEIGTVAAQLDATGLDLPLGDGIKASADASLQASWQPQPLETEARELPFVTGAVNLRRFEYTRPIRLRADLTSLTANAKRTKVESKSPDDDLLRFEVLVRSNSPLRVKNNLVSTEFLVGQEGIVLAGTNQRFGARGQVDVRPGGTFNWRRSEFEIREGYLRFDDLERIAPKVDITAVTKYRRYSNAATAGGASAAPTTGGTATSSSTATGGSWDITMHAYGEAEAPTIVLTSEPALAQDDIFLLLTFGLTRAELDQQTNLGSFALDLASNVIGAGAAVTEAVPVIDEFRFGSAYSSRTGRTEPTVTVGKRLSRRIRASVTSGISDSREVRSNIGWRVGNGVSVEGSYDNVNDISSSALGNLGADIRWRLEFE